jgi:hypothetical protein
MPIRSRVAQVFQFIGEFWPNFDLKNMISTYAKNFSWKKLA